MKHTLHIDPTYAPLPHDEDCGNHAKRCACYWCVGDTEDEQIDRIVWQQPQALMDRVPLPVLEVAVYLVMLFLAVGVIAALGGVR